MVLMFIVMVNIPSVGEKGSLNLISSTEFNGEWMGRIEYWGKVMDFPEELKDYIIQECRKAVIGMMFCINK